MRLLRSNFIFSWQAIAMVVRDYPGTSGAFVRIDRTRRNRSVIVTIILQLLSPRVEF